jgi:CPA1 family monovalent cation:H+ antiporter
MPMLELVVALVLAAAGLAGLARALRVHYAILLVLGGLALGLIPGVPAPRVEPDVIFFVFLPPLIYAAAYRSSPQDLRANLGPIARLSIGLVLATMAAVAAVAHVVAGIGWGPAIVLGAILGPTDPVAATSVLRRVGAPDRISTILEGESLVNDGTGLTVYKLAVAAVGTGAFSLASSLSNFALALCGVGIGLFAGAVSAEIRRRIDEPPIEVSISLLTAYLAYIPAERIGSSGILAVVAAGLYTGRRSPAILSAPSRLQMLGFWDVMTFLLESVLFLLIGLQLPHITAGLGDGIGMLLLQSLAVVAAVIGVRIGWMFAVPLVLRLLGVRVRGPAAPPSSREQAEARRAELLVLGWSGMRGAVSLAAALAVPLAAGAHSFPARDAVIFIAYMTIIGTLVLAGVSLPWLVRGLGIAEGEELARAEAKARMHLAHAALKRIEEAAEQHDLPDGAIAQLRARYESRLHRLSPQVHGDRDGHGGDESEIAWRLRELHRELIGTERSELRKMRRASRITAEAAKRIERDLDLEESRIAA